MTVMYLQKYDTPLEIAIALRERGITCYEYEGGVWFHDYQCVVTIDSEGRYVLIDLNDLEPVRTTFVLFDQMLYAMARDHDVVELMF